MNMGQIDNGMMKGTWGDYETGRVRVDLVKHHSLVTMKAGKRTETLRFRTPDSAGAGWVVNGGVLTKTADEPTEATMPLST